MVAYSKNNNNKFLREKFGKREKKIKEKEKRDESRIAFE